MVLSYHIIPVCLALSNALHFTFLCIRRQSICLLKFSFYKEWSRHMSIHNFKRALGPPTDVNCHTSSEYINLCSTYLPIEYCQNSLLLQSTPWSDRGRIWPCRYPVKANTRTYYTTIIYLAKFPTLRFWNWNISAVTSAIKRNVCMCVSEVILCSKL